MSRARSRCLSLALGAFIALTACGRARARIVDLTRLGGSVEVGAEVGLQRTTSPSASDRKFNRTRVEERLGLELGGFVLTPRLLTFDLGGTVGLRQDWLDASGTERGFNHGRMLEYDARLSLLPVKPVSLTLFGTRFDDRTLRSFGTDTEASGQAYGATLRLGNPWFPSTFTWQRLRSLSQNRGGLVESRREEARELLELSGQHFSEAIQARLRLRDEDVDDRSIPSVGDSHVREADTMFGFRWGPYFEKSWRASGRYFQRKGRFDFENLFAGSTFEWDVTEDFTARLGYDFNRFESASQQTNSHSGALSLSHQYYESIWTSLRLFGDGMDQTGGERLAYGGGFSFAYRKKLPWSSRLLADLGIDYRIEDLDAASRQLAVTGERLSLENLSDNFLANRRIDPASIQVFESLDGRLLVEGLDYDVRVVGDLTSIEILLGGSLEEGDIVSVNYRFEVDPRIKTATRGLRYGLGWDAGWLRLRYDHSQSDERLLAGAMSGTLQDSRHDTFRVDLRGRARALRGSASAAFTRDRTAQVTYDEFSFRQGAAWKPWRDLEVTLRLRERWRSFESPERRRTSTLGGRASLSRRLSQTRRMRAFVDYARSKDSETPGQRDLELGVDGRFDVGKIELRPALSWLRRSRGGSAVSDFRASLWVRRSF